MNFEHFDTVAYMLQLCKLERVSKKELEVSAGRLINDAPSAWHFCILVVLAQIRAPVVRVLLHRHQYKLSAYAILATLLRVLLSIR